MSSLQTLSKSKSSMMHISICTKSANVKAEFQMNDNMVIVDYSQ